MPSASGLPSAEQAPRLSTKKESATKARRQAEEEAAAPAPDALLRAAATAPQRNPLLDQALPGKLAALLDMFGGCRDELQQQQPRRALLGRC